MSIYIIHSSASSLLKSSNSCCTRGELMLRRYHPRVSVRSIIEPLREEVRRRYSPTSRYMSSRSRGWKKEFSMLYTCMASRRRGSPLSPASRNTDSMSFSMFIGLGFLPSARLPKTKEVKGCLFVTLHFLLYSVMCKSL